MLVAGKASPLTSPRAAPDGPRAEEGAAEISAIVLQEQKTKSWLKQQTEKVGRAHIADETAAKRATARWRILGAVVVLLLLVIGVISAVLGTALGDQSEAPKDAGAVPHAGRICSAAPELPPTAMGGTRSVRSSWGRNVD